MTTQPAKVDQLATSQTMPLSITGKLESIPTDQSYLSGPLMSHACEVPLYIGSKTVSVSSDLQSIIFDVTFPKCIPQNYVPNAFLRHIQTLNGFYSYTLFIERVAIKGFTFRIRWYKIFANRMFRYRETSFKEPELDFLPSYEAELSDENPVLEIPVEVPHFNVPMVTPVAKEEFSVENVPETRIIGVLETTPVLTPLHPTSFAVNLYVKVNIKPVMTGNSNRMIPISYVVS